MGRAEGLFRQWADQMAQVVNTKNHAPLHAFGALMTVLPCLDYL